MIRSRNRARNGGGVAFSPLDISGLQLWLDAADTATITHSSGSVSQWNDKSGNNNHAVQVTSTSRPSTGNISETGLNCLKFDGVDDFMSLPSSLYNIPNGDNTVFVAFKPNNSNDQAVLSGSNATATDTFGIYVITSGMVRAYHTTYFTPASTNDIPSAGRVVTYSRKSSGSFAAYSRGLSGGGVTATSFVLTDLRLGRNSKSSTSFLNGYIFEILIFNRSISDAEAARIKTYLEGRWIYGSSYNNLPSILKGRSSVVTFGDSITQQYYASSEDKRYPNIIADRMYARLLNQGISGTPMQNTNMNTGSPKPNNGRDRYVSALTGSNKRDLCVIMYGTNDLGFQSQTNFSLANFVNDYQEVITGLLGLGYTVNDIILCSPPYIQGYNFDATFTGSNVTIHEQYVAAVRQLAHDNGLYYVDVYDYTKNNGGNSLMYTDQLHPNDAGHLAIAISILSTAFRP